MQFKIDKARDIAVVEAATQAATAALVVDTLNVLDKAKAQLDAATNAETQAKNPIENVIQMVSNLATMTMTTLSSTQ